MESWDLIITNTQCVHVYVHMLEVYSMVTLHNYHMYCNTVDKNISITDSFECVCECLSHVSS